jgi:hypothetical protein
MAPGPTLPAALAFLFGAFFFERLSGQTGFDPDGFHQMALFREWLRTGTLPLHDTFAFTHTVVPAVQHEWGAGALLYGIATTVGAPGIMWVRWLISAAAALVAARAARRRAPAVVVAFCAPFAIILAQVGFTTIRAGLYTMLFLAVLLAAIERDRDQPRAGRFLLVYLPVVALWINLHGGWIVGVAAVALHLVEQALRRRPIRHLVLALAATPLLMGLTPYGRAYFTGWWRSITFPRDQIAEWLPLYRSSYLLGLAAFGLAMLFLIYAVARRGPRQLPGLAFVVVAAWAAWRHERHVALFALAWFCAVPGYLAATPLGELLEAAVARRPFARALSLASIAVGVALLAVAAPRHPFRLRVPAQGSDLAAGGVVYPAGAVAYLAGANFHGRLVTSFIKALPRGARQLRRSLRGRLRARGAGRGPEDSPCAARLERDRRPLCPGRDAGGAERAAGGRAAGHLGAGARLPGRRLRSLGPARAGPAGGRSDRRGHPEPLSVTATLPCSQSM